MRILTIGFTTSILLSLALPASAKDFPYKRNVTLSVGQSIVLKGVRGNDCSKTTAPGWGGIRGKLPKSKLGTFSDGGAGMVTSNSCGGKVAARGVQFTAKTKGSERFTVYDDAISITVK